MAAGQALAFDSDEKRPAINAGRPTLTDPATLTAPGWLETEFGIQRLLQDNRLLQTPLLLKLTGGNRRTEYRLQTDGYSRMTDDSGNAVSGIGDTYAALQYLATSGASGNWYTAVRGTVKLPTASASKGIGSGKADYGALFLASRDLSQSLHLDVNAGLAALGQPACTGFDRQIFLSASTTMPIGRGKWQYTNELAYQAAAAGSDSQLTMMHGISYSVQPWDVWDAAINFGLNRGAPKYQVLFGRTFFLGRLF